MVEPTIEREIASREYDFAVAGGEKRFGPHHNLIEWNAHGLSTKVWNDAESAFPVASVLNFQISTRCLKRRTDIFCGDSPYIFGDSP
jgi:hypothetical protein